MARFLSLCRLYLSRLSIKNAFEHPVNNFYGGAVSHELMRIAGPAYRVVYHQVLGWCPSWWVCSPCRWVPSCRWVGSSGWVSPSRWVGSPSRWVSWKPCRRVSWCWRVPTLAWVRLWSCGVSRWAIHAPAKLATVNDVAVKALDLRWRFPVKEVTCIRPESAACSADIALLSWKPRGDKFSIYIEPGMVWSNLQKNLLLNFNISFLNHIRFGLHFL